MPDDPPKADPDNTDIVVLGAPTADGDGVHVLRARNEKLETGELRALRDGRPVTGEVVTLEPRKDEPRICDVRASWRPPSPAEEPASKKGKGPAQVATKAYRDGWDVVFDKNLN
jgi:hypothetical protein